MSALASNTTGNDNTASGVEALLTNTTGSNNTAGGLRISLSNTTGIDETATGALALQNNTTGLYNTADGFRALAANTTGGLNTAAGVNALYKNTTGAQNTAVGVNVMIANTTGSNNIALGYLAGAALTTGSNNIDIGNQGVAADTNCHPHRHAGHADRHVHRWHQRCTRYWERRGGKQHRPAWGRGVFGPLQARYPGYGRASALLMKLRPVNFRYKGDDPEHPAVRPGGGRGRPTLSRAGDAWHRRQGRDGALLDAHLDAA